MCYSKELLYSQKNKNKKSYIKVQSQNATQIATGHLQYIAQTKEKRQFVPMLEKRRGKEKKSIHKN